MPKHLKSKGLAHQGKRILAHDVDEPNHDQKCPVFSFEHLQSAYCITNCTSDERAAFTERMRLLSQLTWAQIKCLPKHGLGFEKIAQHAIQTGIPSHITADVALIAFRFFGKAPMVGYRDRRIFHILWFDRDFTLYDHG
ncbi:MAG: hypothetical protein HOP19_02075 [Acidobacteria bacterium]|nr:hypothetical protein [Acidobacteriota bacterium]